jgi:hypothetical protein
VRQTEEIFGGEVKAHLDYFHCGDRLKKTLAHEIADVESAIDEVKWDSEFRHCDSGSDTANDHQTGYNKAFGMQFLRRGWDSQPTLRKDPKLIGDFQKGLVFVEIQFGNSAALYRDYYKFQYGLANGLLSLAVLVVPTTAKKFFPTRPKSVHNMAEYALAQTCLRVLPINVPTLLVGLRAEN